MEIGSDGYGWAVMDLQDGIMLVVVTPIIK
jgi:hypothetical protein